MFKLILILAFLATSTGWSEDRPRRSLAGSVACLSAIQFASQGKVGDVRNLLSLDENNQPQAVGMKGERDGKKGIYVYTANSAKFFPYPPPKAYHSTTNNKFHRMKIDINGKPYLIDEISDESEKKMGLGRLSDKFPTVFVETLKKNTEYNDSFQAVSGRDVLDDSTVNLLADEVRTRTEQILTNFNNHLAVAQQPGVNRELASGDYVKNFLNSYSNGLQVCQNNLILSQKAAEALREIKSRDLSSTVLYKPQPRYDGTVR